MDYTLLASDLIDAVVTEGQSATTNRYVLLDYLNRVHQRILRESQFAFLKSERKSFLTVEGVQNYWIGDSTQKPNNYLDTNLNLTDFDSLLVDSVLDETEGFSLEFVSARVNNYAAHNPDGTEFVGPVRSFSVKFDLPGGMRLHPVPSGNNTYEPVPTTPYVGQTLGGFSPARILFVTCTLVDSAGGESLPCKDPAVIQVAPGQLVTIQPPEAITGGSNGITYGRWNVYVGYSLSTMTKQNTDPLSLFTPFTEPANGFTGVVYPDVSVSVHPNYYVAVTNNGLLQQIITPTGRPNAMVMTDTSGKRWQFGNDANGITQTIGVASNITTTSQPFFYVSAPGGSIWMVTVNTQGLLQSTAVSGVVWNPGQTPPTVSTIIGLSGDVISFRYMKTRRNLSLGDTLQIPDRYRDVVLAGLNYYATNYLKTDEAKITSARWMQEFKEGLAQIRKDLRLSVKTADMILPDGATQYNLGFFNY